MNEKVERELAQFSVNQVKKEEWEFGLLPVISGAAVESAIAWMDDFRKLSEEAKIELVGKVIEWLGETNEELAAAIVGTTEGVLMSDYEALAHKLTKAEWDDLLFAMRFSYLVVLRALNEALREREGS